MSSGILSTVAIGKESTWGTAVAPSITIPVNFSGGLQTNVDVQLRSAARGNLAKNYAAHAGKRVHEGDLELDLLPDSVGYFLYSAFGGVSSALASGESIVYDHTFSESGTKKSYTVEQAIGEVIRRYAGTIAKTIKINAKTGEAATMTASLIAKSSATATQTSPTTTTVKAINFHQVTVAIGGVSMTQAENVEIEYSSGVELKHALAGSVDPQLYVVRGSEIKGKIECYLDSGSAAEFTNYLSGTERDIVITMTGAAVGVASNYKLVITIPKAAITAADVQITDDSNMIALSFDGIFDSATSKLVSAVLTNLTASY